MSRSRSPGYPNFSLRKAVQYAADIFEQDRRNLIDRDVVAKHMGYSGLSGAADKAIASMMHYGLLSRVGKGEVQVSQTAVDILHPDTPSQKKEALVRAAFSPKLFRELKGRFPEDKFSEESLRSYLMRENFMERAIPPVIKAYVDTCALLKQENAYESGGGQGGNQPDSEQPEDGPTVYGGAAVGDLIQWVSEGALQFPKPLPVRAVSEDGQWVWVEDSETGLPMDSVVVEKKASDLTPPIQPPRLPLGSGSGHGGKPQGAEAEWMRNKVGRSTNVRLLVDGEMGPKEIGRLIKLLETQRSILEEDPEDDGA